MVNGGEAERRSTSLFITRERMITRDSHPGELRRMGSWRKAYNMMKQRHCVCAYIYIHSSKLDESRVIVDFSQSSIGRIKKGLSGDGRMDEKVLFGALWLMSCWYTCMVHCWQWDVPPKEEKVLFGAMWVN